MSRGLQNPLSPSEQLRRHAVNIPDTTTAYYQPLYDYQTKAAGTTMSQRFFADPIGQNGKTVVDTNMELSGQIPAGQMFVITGIQVELYPTIDINNADSDFTDAVYQFYNSGALKLKIGSTDWITQGNLMKFAPVNRLGISAATGEDGAYTYATACGREFAVNKLTLESSQNFSVELINAVTPDDITCRVGVTLNGWQYRNAQ